MSDANDTKAVFESWFADEWAAFEDKPIFSEIKAKVWALKAWYARAAAESENIEALDSSRRETKLLQKVPVARDENGFWSPPDLIHFWHVEMQDAERCTKEQWEALEQRAGIKTQIVHLESESMDHPAYISYFDNGSPDISEWDPSPQPGWWLIDICDNEDGPFAVWATHK